MKGCYARKLGDCSSTLSLGHPLSRGLYPDGALVEVDEAPWLKVGQKVSVPIKSLAQRMLCTHHNSALSYLDSEGIRFSESIMQLYSVQKLRSKLKRSSVWSTKRVTLNGHVLEKYLAKLAIGSLQSVRKDIFFDQGNLISAPPISILNVIFGTETFKQPMGLYAMNMDNSESTREHLIQHRPYIDTDTQVYSGSFVYFHGFQFMLYLSNEDPRGTTFQCQNNSFLNGNFTTKRYRPKAYNFSTKGKRTGRQLNWTT